MVYTGQGVDNQQPGPYKHEGPETQHLRQPGNSVTAQLRHQTHDHCKAQGPGDGSYCSFSVHHPSECVHPLPEHEHYGDQREKDCKQYYIHRPGEVLPTHRSAGNLQAQTQSEYKSSCRKAFFNGPMPFLIQIFCSHKPLLFCLNSVELYGAAYCTLAYRAESRGLIGAHAAVSRRAPYSCFLVSGSFDKFHSFFIHHILPF